MSKAKILVVEDESVVAKDIQDTLCSLGYGVPFTVSSGKAAIRSVEKNKPDLVLMDIVLKGGVDGIEVAKQIRSRFNIPVVYLTAYTDDNMLKRAKVTEPYGYLIKPFNDRELRSVIEMALYKAKMENRLKESEEWLSTVLESIREGIIATDVKGCVRFMNPIAQSLTDWRQKEAKGKHLKDILKIFDKKNRKEVRNLSGKIIQKCAKMRLRENTVLTNKKGREILVELNGAPIKNGKGDITGVVIVFQDITEREKAREKLQKSKEELESKVEELETFTKVAVGRELRIVKLKDEIEELKEKLNA